MVAIKVIMCYKEVCIIPLKYGNVMKLFLARAFKALLTQCFGKDIIGNTYLTHIGNTYLSLIDTDPV